MAEEIQPALNTAAADSTNPDTDQAETDQERQGMPLLDHLQEFRKRILISVVAIAAGSSISWFYAGQIIDILIHPVGKMVFLNPAEAFFAYLKVSLFAGLMLALPVVMHQVWTFVVPALHDRERSAVLMLGPFSVLLFVGGVVFAYYLVLPAAVKFFLGFATDQLQPMLSLGSYITFIISFLLPFGLVFELPLFLIALAKLGVITSQFLVAKRKIFLVLSFVIGALAAPTPDVFSQTMVAVPLLLLYELSILVIRHGLKR